MPDKIGKVSAVTRLIEPRSFSSTISPSISEVACVVGMAESFRPDQSCCTRND
jgi:hypothetical protein